MSIAAPVQGPPAPIVETRDWPSPNVLSHHLHHDTLHADVERNGTLYTLKLSEMNATYKLVMLREQAEGLIEILQRALSQR